MKGSENKGQLWRTRVELQRSSGLSVKLWCEREKISQSKFYEWRKRVLSEGEKVPNLIKVSMAGQGNDGGLEILTPLGYVIRLSSVTQVSYLRAIISSLS